MINTYKITGIKANLDYNDIQYCLSNELKIPYSSVRNVQLIKRSIDARNKSNVHYVLSLSFESDNKIYDKRVSEHTTSKNIIFCAQKNKSLSKKTAIIGSGPCGLFSALYLTALGHKVILIEKGSDALTRQQKINSFFSSRVLDEECNVQFGLGGAGTFSDGKLTTGISSNLLFTIFDTFKHFGAHEDIMYSSNAHIGTDILIKVVENMATWLQNNGCEVHFDTNMTDILVENNAVYGVEVENRGISRIINCDNVIVACGHSSRDVFKILQKIGAPLEKKPFAMGVRIEHTRQMIDNAQYGFVATHRDIGSADYKMVEHLPNGRSVYTFCMCPGGEVICASSEKGGVVTNGMSYRSRDKVNSNSALLVNITPNDLEGDIFAGVEFQRKWEQKAFSINNDYSAPAQNVVDFLLNKKTNDWSVNPTYPLGVKSADLREYLPDFIWQSISDALPMFGKRIKGFDKSGVMTAIESRSSSPIKVLRQSNMTCGIDGLYVAGEGAGYAGGIVSAGVDGLKIAIELDSLCK